MIKEPSLLAKKLAQLKHRYTRRKEVLEANDRDYNEVLSHAIFAFRRPLCRAMTRAVLKLTNHNMGGPVGETLWKWRSVSVTSGLVSRVVIDLLLEHPVVTVSQVETQCHMEVIKVKRTTVTKILNQAVELEILTVNKSLLGGNEYSMTDVAREELIDRMALKYTDPDVVRFARKVVMIDEMRSSSAEVYSQKTRNPNPMDADESLFELALNGAFDEVKEEGQ